MAVMKELDGERSPCELAEPSSSVLTPAIGLPPTAAVGPYSEAMDVDKVAVNADVATRGNGPAVGVEDGSPTGGSSTELESSDESRVIADEDRSDPGDGPSKRRRMGDKTAASGNVGARGRSRRK